MYALIVATVIGLAVLARIYLRAENDKQRKELRLIIVLTGFSLAVLGLCPAGRQLHQPVYRPLREPPRRELWSTNRDVPVG